MEQDPKTSWDIVILPIEGDEASGWKPGKPTVFLNSPFVEVWPEFSPDGRWLAYMSNESGRYEVYVRPFPGPGGKWQISTEGGGVPDLVTDEPRALLRTRTGRSWPSRTPWTPLRSAPRSRGP